VSYVHPENLASAAIAERLGATLDPNALKPNPGALVYRHL
jgi:RimJ/RimL family protein N-acetyltransferase